MGAFKSFLKGSSATNKRWRVLITLWIINILFSITIFAPIHALLKSDISRSLMGDRLLQNFDYAWMADTIYKYQNISSFITSWLWLPAAFYLLLYVFLNGGILGSLKTTEGKVTLKQFFSDCGQYFWRFFKLFLISILVYLLVLGLLNGIIGKLLKLFTKNAATEWPLIIVSNLKMIIFILLFSIVNMFFDYTKIRLVLEDSRKVLKETWQTLKFAFHHFCRAWGLYWIIGLLNIILTIIYMEIAHLLPKNHLILVLIVFIWQQAYIFSRVWIKVNFFASQMQFYRSHSS